MEQQHKRFYDACGKLVNSFIMDKISHGNSCECAVGTLCNANPAWKYLSYKGSIIGINQIEPTGYSAIEIFEIEKHFEERITSAYHQGHWGQALLDKNNDADCFKGLCNVFDYLVSIEDFSDEESKVNLIEMCLQNN